MIISYQLVFELTVGKRLNVGQLGTFDFPAGLYVYTGSATRSVLKRIHRHLSREKSCHWHIDTLTLLTTCRFKAIRLSQQKECDLNQRTPGWIVAPGMGATDCRHRCNSHLKLMVLSGYRIPARLDNIPPVSQFAVLSDSEPSPQTSGSTHWVCRW